MEMIPINNIPLGSIVAIDHGNNTGTVTAIAVYLTGSVIYEVSWWFNGERKSCWMSSLEIDSERTIDRGRMGFTSISALDNGDLKS